MKFVLVCLAIISILGADEINRIDSIVKDISNLREKYESCQKELNSGNSQKIAPKVEVQKEKIYTCQKEKTEIQNYKKLLKQEQEKNQDLTQKRDLAAKEKPNKNKIDKIILKLENELKNRDILLKTKEKEIIILKKEIEEYRENKQISLNNTKTEKPQQKSGLAKVCQNENTFPKLMMKEKRSSSSLKNKKIYRTKPTTYRLKANSMIYNKIDGQKVYEWEENTSFTSNIRSDEWIKITGYFVNRIWQKSSEELWVKNLNVIER